MRRVPTAAQGRGWGGGGEKRSGKARKPEAENEETGVGRHGFRVLGSGTQKTTKAGRMLQLDLIYSQIWPELIQKMQRIPGRGEESQGARR